MAQVTLTGRSKGGGGGGMLDVGVPGPKKDTSVFKHVGAGGLSCGRAP